MNMETGKITVKTVVQSETPNPFHLEYDCFENNAEALNHIGSLFADGTAFSVTWGIWEDDDLLDAEYTSRAEAVEDARKMEAGEDLD